MKALLGNGWDEIRALRKKVIGDELTVLSEREVPPDLVEVLPLASLLSTGEEGLWTDFRLALDDEARHYVTELLERKRDAIDEFVAASKRPMSEEAFALMDLIRIYDYWCYDWKPAPPPAEDPLPPLEGDELRQKSARVASILQKLKKT